MNFEDFKKDFDEKLAAMSDEELLKSFEYIGCKLTKIICLNCKTITYTSDGELFVCCYTCSPNHPTFHKFINL